MAEGLATYAPDPDDPRRQTITLTDEGSTLLHEMESDFDRWSKRLAEKLGKENIAQTIEHLHELNRVLDTDSEYFDDQTD